MSAFEFLTKLAKKERLSITYISCQKDSNQVEMTLKIPIDKPIMAYLNTKKTYEVAKNTAAKTALKYIKHFF